MTFTTKNDIKSLLRERILLLDGGLGTMIQGYGLGEDDFRGERFAAWEQNLRGCNDVLVLSRPDIIAEIHKKYLDIHVDITGNELIETGGEGTEVSYDENRDFGVVECENANSSYMSPDDFYICMLDEPHKPACAAPGKDKAIKKCIFKVLV